MDYRDIKEFSKDMIKYLLIAVVVLVVIIYVVSLQQVVGPSMNPKYKDSDILILNKLNYKIVNPKRFEVVAINSNQNKYFIKRVIGLPGEHIEYKQNKLFVNGKEINEKFTKNGETKDFKLEDIGYTKIPDNYYLVLGDNRINSQDSRDIKVGLIKEKDFIGKVLFRIWPIRK